MKNYENINTKKTATFCNILVFIIFFGAGFLSYAANADLHPAVVFFKMFFYILLALFVSIIIHESGHLVTGLITGYKFVSFRILNILIYRKKNKVKIKLGKGVALGQCLLSIKDPQNSEKMSVDFYLAGGSLFNFLTFIITLPIVLYEWLNYGNILLFLAILCLISLYLTFVNYLPLNVNGLYNDGLNIKIADNEEARLTLINSLYLNELLVEGLDINEISDELIDNYGIHPSKSYVNYFPFSSIKTLKLYYNSEKEEAKKLIRSYLYFRSVLPKVYQNIITILYLLLMLFTEPDKEELLKYLDDKNRLLLLNNHNPYSYLLKAIYLRNIENDQPTALKTYNKGLKLVNSINEKAERQVILKMYEEGINLIQTSDNIFKKVEKNENNDDIQQEDVNEVQPKYFV